ncbi:RNA polymerase sigma factor [Cytobacillus gottheilii]|uniref:RNA polymerase sigma factor n=1 Tax=Cytobacillus gottheilii TaxID=859144 RepID=UPI003CFB7827
MITLTDARLLKKIKKNDLHAVLDWFDDRKEKFYNIGWSYLKSHHDVEDVFQNTILKVNEKIGQLKEDRYFESWVTSIFINECRFIYRKRKKTDVQEHEEAVKSNELDTRITISASLTKLDVKYRELIVLKYIQGFSQEEISELLNLPIGTVKSRLYRGLLILRKIMEEGEES